MYVQLLVGKQLDLDGRARAYERGDWVNIGKQLALRWIAVGDARTAIPITLDISADCGVVATGALGKRADALQLAGVSYRTSEAPACLYERTLIYDPTCPLRIDLLAAGFNFLERWEAAAPIWSYEERKSVV